MIAEQFCASQVLLYSSKMLNTTNLPYSQLDAFDTLNLHNILRIHYTRHVTNVVNRMWKQYVACCHVHQDHQCAIAAALEMM